MENIPEAEMSATLLEFHQRNQSLIKPVGPPPPFEITSSVRQQQPILQQSRRQDNPPPEEQPKALVAPENEVDFYAGSSQHTMVNPLNFDFWFRGHNQGKISRPCFIRSYQNYWYWVQPITRQRLQSHVVFPSFNGSTWTPPAPDQPAINIQVSCILDGLPAPGTFGFAGELWINMFVEYEDTGEDMEHIYGHGGSPFYWEWRYPPPRSIGITIYFA